MAGWGDFDRWRENVAALGLGVLAWGSWGRLGAAEVGLMREGGTVQLMLKGEDGKEYSVEAVENLLNEGLNWTPIATVAPARQP